MRNILTVFLVLNLLTFCGNTMDKEKALIKLIETDKEFALESVKTNAASAFRKYLADNALSLSDKQLPLKGKNSIFETMKPGADSYRLSWNPEDGEVASSCDFGYTWGNYTLTDLQTGAEKNGEYLNVWKKDSAGNWKVLVDMGNSNP